VYVPATVSVTVIGLDAPDAVAPDELVIVYELIGSLLKEGAVNVTDIAPDPPSVAVPIVGTPGVPLAEPDDELRIGIALFYLTNQTLTPPSYESRPDSL